MTEDNMNLNILQKSVQYSKALADPGSYLWVKSSKNLWVLRFENLSAYFALVAIPASIIYFIAIIWYALPISIPIVVIITVFFLIFTGEYLKQNIKCPTCSYKPSMSKDNKLVKSQVLNDRLLKLKSCPKCKKG